MIKREALEELDFFQILEIIKSFSRSEATKRLISQIYPCETLEQAREYLREFEEIRENIEREGELPILQFPDIESLLNIASKEGVLFDARQLSDFLRFLKASQRLESRVEGLLRYESLRLRISQILGSSLKIGQPYLLERLERTVDDEGNILDTASTTLRFLRKQIRATEERIKDKLEEILNRRDVIPFLQDRFITKRNDRWVIPVRMDSKGQVRGKVQDISRSGETAFIEPEEISGLSKRLEELRVEERLEEIRILRELSEQIHQASDSLRRDFELLCYLDRLNSIYGFSVKFSANPPLINSNGEIELINARHPILTLTKEHVEPLNLSLSKRRVLVITGPNAGGKTVALKTIGLLCALAVSGLPIPANPSSKIPFFSSLFVDLYHEGSIREQLSSFASHVVKLREIIEKADHNSLVILDEIGTNTDPEEGAALACAVIEELRDRASWTFLTTHLSKVKLFAATTEGVEVAAMAIDETTMTPLYRLSLGSIATSYALEVARKYGLPERVLRRALEIKGSEDIRIYQLMSELQKVKEEYDRKLAELKEAEKGLFKEREALELKIKEAEQARRRAIEEGKKEAYAFVTKIKREINQLYEEAKRADRKKLKDVSKRLSQVYQTFESTEQEGNLKVQVGETVRVKNSGLVGKVIELSHGRVKIQTEGATVEVNLSQVEKVTDLQRERNARGEPPIMIDRVVEQTERLDIRGLRVDEAIPLIERFINELSLKEVSRGVIVHGIGKGILRDAVRDYLKSHPAVAQVKKADVKEGGEAVTVVELR